MAQVPRILGGDRSESQRLRSCEEFGLIASSPAPDVSPGFLDKFAICERRQTPDLRPWLARFVRRSTVSVWVEPIFHSLSARGISQLNAAGKIAPRRKAGDCNGWPRPLSDGNRGQPQRGGILSIAHYGCNPPQQNEEIADTIRTQQVNETK
jgi:hypothetical protein